MMRRSPVAGGRPFSATATATTAEPPSPTAPIATEARAQRSFRRLVVILFAVYMLFAVAMYVWVGVTFTPDIWMIALLIGAVVLGRAASFLRDWIPFVFLIFGYEFLRGIAWHFVRQGGYSAEDHGRIQLESLIAADKFLFGGTVPTIWLQERFYDPGTTHWYDIMSVIVYGLHFVLPLVFAFVLWLQNRERFWQFSLAFLAMTYAAFAIFLLVPAAPPWLAHQWGFLENVEYPSYQAFKALLPRTYDGVNTFKLWSAASPNPVAALPSLHAAFPWLVLLFSVRYFGKKGWLFLIYNAAIWFSVVYLTQHWVVDIIAGMAWATLWYLVVIWAWPRLAGGFTLPFESWFAGVGRRIQAALPAPFQRSPDRG